MRTVAKLAALAVASWTVSASAQVQVASPGPVVALTVTSAVKARPDLATVTAGVSTTAPTATAAMQGTATTMTAVIARLKAQGVAEDDIQTSGIGVAAQYDYGDGSRRFTGYQASNRVDVILRRIATVGPVLDALVEAGANDISGPTFSIADNRAALAAARKAALADAAAQAEAYAAAVHYAGVRLLEVRETVPQQTSVGPNEIVVTASKRTATPVEPGLAAASVTLTVTYELTR